MDSLEAFENVRARSSWSGENKILHTSFVTICINHSALILTVVLFLWFFCCRFLVDETPVRVFRNNENLGVPFPNSQGVGIYASIWDGSNWATDDGWVKLNWTYAPFIASFQDFGVDACEVEDSNVEACIKARGMWWNLNTYLNLNANQIQALHNVQSNYLVYDYCTDTKRYPTMPVECASNWYEWTIFLGGKTWLSVCGEPATIGTQWIWVCGKIWSNTCAGHVQQLVVVPTQWFCESLLECANNWYEQICEFWLNVPTATGSTSHLWNLL